MGPRRNLHGSFLWGQIYYGIPSFLGFIPLSLYFHNGVLLQYRQFLLSVLDAWISPFITLHLSNMTFILTFGIFFVLGFMLFQLCIPYPKFHSRSFLCMFFTEISLAVLLRHSDLSGTSKKNWMFWFQKYISCFLLFLLLLLLSFCFIPYFTNKVSPQNAASSC